MYELQNSILEIADKHYDYLMSLENVNGIGLGYKSINEKYILEPCIQVLVNEKINSKYISRINLIPKSYMGIKTDVIKTEVKTYEDFNRKVRPLRPGYSIGVLPKVEEPHSGTITCFVTKIIKKERRFFILSNNHVLAGGNKVPLGSAIIQPSKLNGGSLKDYVGVLTDYIPIKRENFFFIPINYVDCAIAEIDKTLISNRIKSIGKIKGVAKPSLKLKVIKIGKNTGITKGEIITIGATRKFKVNSNKFSIFKKQIITTTKSIAGDSGASLLNYDNEIIGLMIGGDDSTSTFNDINLVLTALNVDVYTG